MLTLLPVEGARILEDDSSHDYEDTVRFRLTVLTVAHVFATCTHFANQTAVHDNREAWRYMFPFFVLIGLFLLGVWKIVTPSSPYSIDCKGKSIGYKVQAGDSCWSVADAHKIDVEDLKHMNPSLDCDPLVTGKEICVPRS